MKKLFLYFGIIDYKGSKQRPHHICEQFKKDGWDVLYVEPIGNRGGTVQQDGITLTSLIEGPFIKMQIGTLNTEYLWDSVREWFLKESRKHERNEVVFWVNTPYWLPLLKVLKHAFEAVADTHVKIVYDVLDYLWGFTAYALFLDTLMPMHDELACVVADRVICTSQPLVDSIPKSVLVKNACDYELWDVPLIPQTPPIVGYIGMVTSWFDFELAKAIVKAGYKLEIVGYAHEITFPPELKACYLGEIAYEKLPDVVKRWSCGLILHQMNKLTDCTDPIKAYEYSALGIPIIAKPTLGNLKQKESGARIRLEENESAFVNAIGEELQKNGHKRTTRRKNWAKENTWNIRYIQILQILGDK